jgi:hypothetical protein
MQRRKFLERSIGALAFTVPALVRAADAAWGDLVGRFVFDGQAPERKRLKVDKDVDCCGRFDIRDESLLVGADGGLRNVYVYVRSRDAALCPALEQDLPARVTLDNRDCIFQPHCLKIWYTKQEFYTVNADPVAQNVAFEPLGDVPCNAVLPVGGTATYRFSRRQMTPVLIKCNYHPWESAYILPRDNPYVDISAADGTFRIAKLPVGELEFQAWHERVGYLHTSAWTKGRFKLSIRPGTNDLGTIKLPAAMFPEK